MKAKDLIEKLQKVDPEAEVYIGYDCLHGVNEVDSVRVDDESGQIIVCDWSCDPEQTGCLKRLAL